LSSALDGNFPSVLALLLVISCKLREYLFFLIEAIPISITQNGNTSSLREYRGGGTRGAEQLAVKAPNLIQASNLSRTSKEIVLSLQHNKSGIDKISVGKAKIFSLAMNGHNSYAALWQG